MAVGGEREEVGFGVFAAEGEFEIAFAVGAAVAGTGVAAGAAEEWHDFVAERRGGGDGGGGGRGEEGHAEEERHESGGVAWGEEGRRGAIAGEIRVTGGG